MEEIIDHLHENRQIELAKSILESNGYKVEKKSQKFEESLITEYLPEDELRSAFSDHNLQILSFEQGNQVRAKTRYGSTLTFKVVKNDDGEYEVMNPDYKREFIISD